MNFDELDNWLTDLQDEAAAAPTQALVQRNRQVAIIEFRTVFTVPGSPEEFTSPDHVTRFAAFEGNLKRTLVRFDPLQHSSAVPTWACKRVVPLGLLASPEREPLSAESAWFASVNSLFGQPAHAA